ncbi:hypothetical protein Vretimale_2160 [Volvox reticuliferus]|uniref:Uncharacterized protein n=1 Tax=Volvox reticuliferus TaxID=1737510 RepID=A0A8J4D6H7_9CHLO|nr:hypothetical protein Vretifemale_4546 [Volvox reticuliferus]GIL96445.1 hypothetical protein Vretimale_2160 [Volvox reticuliferus]
MTLPVNWLCTGCGRDLTEAKLYLRRYSVCEPHFKAECVMLGGGRYRFCQQCNKFQAIDNFAGGRRSCKARSEDRNLRRRKQRTDERAMAGDSGEGGPMRLLKGGHPLGALAMPSRVALTETGMLRQLADPNEAVNQLGAAQYANQVQQLLLGGGGGTTGLAAGGGSSAAASGILGGPLQLQVPPSIDLAAALAGAADLSGLGGATSAAQNANALSLLTAAAHGAVRAGAPAGAALADPTVGSNVLQQLQLAHLASALTKGSAAVGPAGMAGLGMGLGAGAVGGGLNVGGVLGTGMNGGNLAHQLLLQQAASAAAVGAGGGGSGVPGLGPHPQPEAAMAATSTTATGGIGSNLDLQNLMAQQLLQQTATANTSGPRKYKLKERLPSGRETRGSSRSNDARLVRYGGPYFCGVSIPQPRLRARFNPFYVDSKVLSRARQDFRHHASLLSIP